MLRLTDKVDIDIASLLSVTVNCDNNQENISFQLQSTREGAEQHFWKKVLNIDWAAGQSPKFSVKFSNRLFFTGNMKE